MTLATVAVLFGFFLAVAGFAALLWRGSKVVPHAPWHVVGATFGFGVLDWIALVLPPYLGLSFGTAFIPLIGITLVRGVLTGSLALAWRWMRKPAPQIAKVGLVSMWVLNAIVFACELEGLYIEPFRLTVTEISVPAPGFLPDGPLRIVQLSDVHVERTTKRERAVVERVRALEPDIIVLTGDYLNISYTHDPITWRDARAFFEQLHAPYGIYAITDSFVDPEDAVHAIFDGLEITVLYDEVRCLPFEDTELCIVGVHRTGYDADRDHEALAGLLDQVPEQAYKLLLYHSPDLIETATANGIDLYLAGHTHGGQIRLPVYGAIFTSSVYGKRYEMGRYTVGETTLYVNRGLGMEGSVAPHVRFLCPPEITVVDIGADG